MEVSKNDIKKYLLKQKPIAFMLYVRKGHIYYDTTIFIGKSIFPPSSKTIFFKIPVDDIGDADFLKEMPAQLLSRWIVGFEEIQ